MSKSKPKVFMNQMGCHLGDMLIFVSAGLRYSEQTGEPVYLEAPNPERGALAATMIEDIADVLDSHGTVIASYERATESFGNLWRRLTLVSTKKRWTPGNYGRVTYQMDGRTMPWKNPPTKDLPIIVKAIESRAEPVKVGLPLTLEESVDALATSDLFVGCASGLAIVAWAVGVPVYYVEYGMRVEPFITGDQRYLKCYGTQGLCAALQTQAVPPVFDMVGKYERRGGWPR